MRLLSYLLICTVTIFVLAGCAAFNGLTQPLPVALPARFSSTPLAVGSKSYPVSSGRVVRTLEFPGVVRANTQHGLYFPVGGGVERVHVKSGDLVLPGDLIAELGSDDAKINLANAEIEAQLAELQLQEVEREIAAAREAAQLNFEAAQLELEKLRLDTRVSNSALEIAEHDVRVAQAQLQQAQLRSEAVVAKQVEAAQLKVNHAQLWVNRLTLRSPITGTVRLGQELRVGRAVDAYTLVGRVVDNETLVIESELNPADLELIATAIPGQVNVTTLSGFTFSGKVLSLPQPYGNGSTPYVQIAPDLGSADVELLEGTNAVVRMQITTSQEVLMLPNDAIQTVAGRNYVVVRENDFVRDQEIAIGLKGDTHTQIIDGLSEGIEIVAP